MIPLVDLKAQHLALKDELLEATARVLEHGNYVQGEEVEAFEHEWAAFCGAKYAVGVSSGTDAIYLALCATDQVFFQGKTKQWWNGEGMPLRPMQVYVPDMTFIATAEPVLRAGVELHLLDVNKSDALMNDAALLSERASSFNDDVVALPVHLYGKRWNRPRGLQAHTLVIEDAAQGHGLSLDPQTLAMTWSFYPTKNLGAIGQGGAVVTNDQALAQKMRELRNHGEAGGRFRHESLSGNYRLDELQAAYLRVKLPHLLDWNMQRLKCANLYRVWCHTAGFDDILSFQEPSPSHVYHIMAARVLKGSRDSLMAFLAQRGIQTAVRYPIPLHQQPALRSLGQDQRDFPGASLWGENLITLPMYPELSSEDVWQVVQGIKAWAEQERLV